MNERPHVYGRRFFEYLDRSSGASAAAFLTHVDLGLSVSSVLDVGCGRGAWLEAWAARGVSDFFGVDGPYVDEGRLLVPRASFAHHDVSQPFDLGRRFDLVQCLEVAEHIHEERSRALLENLARHGSVILFSAATPGQGGEHHVNEQPLEVWADRFHALGFGCYDVIRSQLRERREIEPWYRYNTLLFVHEDRRATLPHQMLGAERRPGQRLPVFASRAWRARNALLRTLPYEAINILAKIKHRVRG
jgi:SAM-dependent methyltransferase